MSFNVPTVIDFFIAELAVDRIPMNLALMDLQAVRMFEILSTDVAFFPMSIVLMNV